MIFECVARLSFELEPIRSVMDIKGKKGWNVGEATAKILGKIIFLVSL